jgi:hypothetical protein
MSFCHELTCVRPDFLLCSRADGSEGVGQQHILSGGADGHVIIHSIA